MNSKTGVYRHYKGTLVRVLFTVIHSESKEEMIVYVHLDDGQLWVRPKKMFEEKIQKDGKEIDRFAPLP